MQSQAIALGWPAFIYQIYAIHKHNQAIHQRWNQVVFADLNPLNVSHRWSVRAITDDIGLK